MIKRITLTLMPFVVTVGLLFWGCTAPDSLLDDIKLPKKTKQVILVITPSWQSPLGVLQHDEFDKTEVKGKDRELVSCGKWDGYNLHLVNKYGEEVEDGHVGEICVKGDSVTSGYWKYKKSTLVPCSRFCE